MNNSYHNSLNASLYEPRITLIKSLLESLLSVVDLESNGQVVQVDGFRLKNLQDWLTPSQCDPFEVLEYAGTRCDCDCVFCYNKGAPPELALLNPPRHPEDELAEMMTRLRYFNPRAEHSLFSSLGSTCEILIHPHIIEILRALRAKTGKCFRIPANGSSLTVEMIKALAELKPVYLDLSLNSASPERRQRLMRSRRKDMAIGALPHLEETGLPYSIVIVPWPLDSEEEMLDDLEKSIEYADNYRAHLVQVSLPGYTKYFSELQLYNLDEMWTKIVERVRELRNRFQVPIVVMPTMYEENLYEKKKNLPRIIGVIRNSPAERGGLMAGDVITKLNGLTVRNRPQARDLLTFLQQSEADAVTVAVERNGQPIECKLDLSTFSYPYFKETDTHLGAVFLGSGLRIGYLEKMRDIIRHHGAKKVILLSSKLVRPTLEQGLSEINLFGQEKSSLDILIPANRFFGGNIFMGDLLVVQDFIDCIRSYISGGEKEPDLVIIPSSPFNLNRWGRDLTGRSYLDIERETGVAVELLPCATLYD